MSFFIERVNRLNLDLLHLVVLQLPQTNDVYSQCFVEKSEHLDNTKLKLFECFYNTSHPKYRPFRCVPYLSSIRNHFTVKTIHKNGLTEYTLNGIRNREGDLPAIVEVDGSQEWWKNGKRHREGDLPAEICGNGDRYWYKNGKFHRDGDLPAYIGLNGVLCWYKNGNCHRDGDMPAIINKDEHEWWTNGKCHREGDLPAVILNSGTQVWYKNGVRHRDGGKPAVIYANQPQYPFLHDEYFYHGYPYHEGGPLPTVVSR